MAEAKRDGNHEPTLLAVSSVDGSTPVVLYADPTTHRLLTSAVAGTLDDLTDVVITAGAQGDVLYRNATQWVNLPAGTNGQVLTSGGAAANPSWTGAGSGDMILASVQTVTGAKQFGTIGGAVGKLILAGSTSGSTILNAAAVAGTTTMTLPTASTTLVGTDTTDTLSNKTLVAPALGTPASGVATNLTGTAAGLTAGTVTTNANLTGHVTSTGNAAVLGSFTMAQLDTAVSDGNVVYQSQALGTPSSGTLTNATGLPATGLTADTTTAVGFGSINLGHASDTTITRSAAGAIQVEGVQVILSGAALGTPSSGTLTNATGLPVSGITASTVTALGVGSVELGHATDTSLTRVSAGVVAIEGVNILTTATGLPLAGGTMTGNITLGENASIDLDPAGSADGKYSGICITGTAGATLAFGDLIYLAVATSRWVLTDADAAATAGTPLIGMCVLAAAGDASATKILLQGQIRADAKFPALTIGAPAYVGETAGAIQVAIPTGADNIIRVVGRALTADELYFCPSQDHQVTVA